MRNLKKILSVLLVVAIMAISMVPAFAATSYTYEAQAKALYDAGLFKGVSATEYAPDLGSALTREQGFALVVRLLGKADKAAALSAADVDAALAAFGDAKDIEPTLKNVVAYAVKNNLVQGDGKLVNPKGAMLGKDLATVILRNLGYKVDAAGYDTAAATLAEKGGLTAAEVTKFATKELIRDDLVGMVYGSLKAKYSTGATVIEQLVADKAVTVDGAAKLGYVAPTAATTLTAKASGAKKFTLTFDGPVDATKVTSSAVTVKKGSSTYTVDSFKLAADKKSADLTISNSIVKGEYEISVTGIVADKAVTAKVTAENEKIDKIVFPSEFAVLDSLTVFTKVNVNFKILNQYGEDVTSKKYSLLTFNTSKGTIDTSKGSDGILAITATSDFTVNEKMSVSGTFVDTDNNNTVFGSAVLSVSQMAQVGEISISKLYNANNETLKIDSVYGDFKLIVDAKDQYGNKIAYNNLASALVMQSTDVSVARLASTFEEITIDGEKKTALSLAEPTTVDSTGNYKAGTTNVILVSKYSGKIGQFEVKVADTQKIDKLTISTPDYPVAGEKFSVPFTATDKDGNEITKLSGLWLKGSPADTHYLTVTGGNASAYFENDPVSGKPVLTVDATNLTDKATLYLTGTTSTYNFVNFTLSVQKPATLESVSGFSSSAYQNLLVGISTGDYKFDNLLVKDSYGRDVTKDKLYSKYKLGQAVAGGYKFTIASSDTQKVNIGSNVPTVANTVYDITTSASSLYALEKGSSTMTLTLMKWDDTKSPAAWVAIDDTTFSVNVVKQEDIVSYTHTAIASIYAYSDAYGESFKDKVPANGTWASGTNGQEIKVEGVLANGKKVLMPRALYAVNTTGDISFDTAVSTTKGKIYSDKHLADDADKDTTATYTITIPGTKNLATQNLTYSVKVSGVAPKAASTGLVATTDKYKTAGYTSFKAESATVASMTYADLVGKDGDATKLTAADIGVVVPNILKFKDQYGTQMTAGYLSGVFYDGNNNLITGTDTGSRPTGFTPYIKSITVTDVKNTNNEIVSANSDLYAGYSVYVTVVTNDGVVYGFTLAIK